ncbi:SapC family protein [Marinobacter hydrocarbonoclasticus]|nr:SapC family protein [Marinobacter nauticus]
MEERFQILNSSAHRELRVSPLTDFSFMAEQHLIPVTVKEFGQACGHLPIVFVKDGETGQFRSVALLGLKGGHNHFVEGSHWKSGYVPQYMIRQPFVLGNQANENGDVFIGIDTQSARVSQEQGERLYTEEGEQTPFLKSAVEFISRLTDNQRLTEMLIELLLKHELLVSKSLRVRAGGQEHTLNGIYMVDEEKLQALPDEEMLEFARKGVLAAAHFHLASLNQLHRFSQ